MEKTMINLNSIKSRCFTLVVCFSLLMGVTSCSNDDFETSAPDEQKKFSNAELIEMALSRMPNRTRGITPFPVVMVTTKKTVTINCYAAEDMEINWSDGSKSLVPKYSFSNYTHTYTDNQPSYVVFIEGSNEAIRDLFVYQNGLIYLDVTNNTKLERLDCDVNQLETLDLTDCPNLKSIYVRFNNLSSIDVSHMPNLELLLLEYNQLTDIDLSKNLNLQTLWLANNQITDLDLTKNIVLRSILLGRLPINTINNLPISSTSFTTFPLLQELNIDNTSFTSLDLSNNPLVNNISISGTAITQLDISNLKIEALTATNSNLTNLVYKRDNLLNATALLINGTPFEELQSNVFSLITALPDRNLPWKNGTIRQGNLYTNSLTLVNPFLSYLTAKNWVVNQ